MKIGKRNAALSGKTGDMHHGLERGQRHAHVGGMRRDAGLAGAEDRVHAIEPLNGRAAAARLALIAGRRGVVEIQASRPLQQVAAGRRHVAQLRGGAGENRARKQRIALLDKRMPGEIGVRHQRADPQAPAFGFLHPVERQPRNIDQPGRTFDIRLHQVDQVGAAGDEFGIAVGGDPAHGIGDIVGAGVLKIDHGCLPIAC